MLNKYYEFLLEKQIYNLILEGKMIFGKDFIEILDTLSTNDDNPVANLAAVIRDYVSKDVEIDSNCIDVSDKPGMISFIPEDKIKEDELTYRVLPSSSVLNYEPSNILQRKRNIILFNELDIPSEGLIGGNIRNLINDTWKVIKNPTSQNWSHLNFYYLEDANVPGRYAVVYSNGTRSSIEPNGSISKRKSDVRLGRFLNKFITAIGKTYSPSSISVSAVTIEKFVNLYEAEIILRKNAFDNFEIVEGEDIRKWYYQKYYEGGSGQLSNSCMRYPSCQDFFDIYVQNPEVCKLLIYLNDFNEVRGRALLWTLSDGTKYMDRIYTSKDSYDQLFLKWCTKNGYTKSIVNSSTVNVEAKDYELYPYMDTFTYYNAEEGKLSNSRIFEKPYAQLDETDGEPDWRT